MKKFVILIIIITCIHSNALALRPQATKNHISALHKRTIAQLLSQDKLIGGGRYRKVYQHNEIVIKIVRPYKHKELNLLVTKLRMPISLFSKLILCVNDINEYEYVLYEEVMNRIPEHLRDSFAKIFEVRHIQGVSVSFNGVRHVLC